MFVKIEGSLVNLDLVYNIDLNDDGTATLWFTGAENVCRDITADDLKVIEAAIRHECVFEEIEQPSPCLEVDLCEMGELKAHNINDLPLHDIANCDFYLKPEADKVIAEKDTEIRRLKRALWLARARNAHTAAMMWEVLSDEFLNGAQFTIDFRCVGDPEVTDFQVFRGCMDWMKIYENVERKCLKKAEEYK